MIQGGVHTENIHPARYGQRRSSAGYLTTLSNIDGDQTAYIRLRQGNASSYFTAMSISLAAQPAPAAGAAGPAYDGSQPVFTCLICSLAFYEPEAQRAHFSSDHHRYNAKVRTHGRDHRPASWKVSTDI